MGLHRNPFFSSVNSLVRDELNLRQKNYSNTDRSQDDLDFMYRKIPYCEVSSGGITLGPPGPGGLNTMYHTEQDSQYLPKPILTLLPTILLAQNDNVLQTEDGRLLGVEDKDLPYARYITQDGNLIITQDDQPLVAQEVNPDSTIQEFITQDGRFLFTQSGDQITTT